MTYGILWAGHEVPNDRVETAAPTQLTDDRDGRRKERRSNSFA